MQKLIVFLVGLGILAAALYAPASYQVVRTERGAIVLHKRFLAYGDTYVDARAFTSADFDNRPDLKQALIDAGYSDLLADLKTRELKEHFAKAMDQAQVAAEQVAAVIKETVDQWLGEPGKPSSRPVVPPAAQAPPGP